MYAKRGQLMIERNVVIPPWDESDVLPDKKSFQQLAAFKGRMKAGEFVVMVPKPEVRGDDSVAVGRIIGKAELRTDLGDAPVWAHSVEWLKKGVAVSAFDPDIRATVENAVLDCCRIRPDDDPADVAQRVLNVVRDDC